MNRRIPKQIFRVRSLGVKIHLMIPIFLNRSMVFSYDIWTNHNRHRPVEFIEIHRICCFEKNITNKSRWAILKLLPQVNLFNSLHNIIYSFCSTSGRFEQNFTFILTPERIFSLSFKTLLLQQDLGILAL